jgi:hypothetical protein
MILGVGKGLWYCKLKLSSNVKVNLLDKCLPNVPVFRLKLNTFEVVNVHKLFQPILDGLSYREVLVIENYYQHCQSVFPILPDGVFIIL